MGRSVSYPRNAIVAFTHLEADEEGSIADDFEWLGEDLQQQSQAAWPSLDTCDRWIGREDRALLVNRHAYVGISEYCGLVAYWIVARDDAEQPALAERWVASVADRFLKTFGTLHKIGTASNGESFFERKAA